MCDERRRERERSAAPLRREANRALAKMSLKEEDCVPDTEGAQAHARRVAHSASVDADPRSRSSRAAFRAFPALLRRARALAARLRHVCGAVCCLVSPVRSACAGLSLMEQDILKDWKAKFEAKYTKVGTVKR